MWDGSMFWCRFVKSTSIIKWRPLWTLVGSSQCIKRRPNLSSGRRFNKDESGFKSIREWRPTLSSGRQSNKDESSNASRELKDPVSKRSSYK